MGTARRLFHLDQRPQLGDGAHVQVHILQLLGAETAQHHQVAADTGEQGVGGVDLALAGAAPEQDGKQLGIAQLVQIGEHAFGGLHGFGQQQVAAIVGLAGQWGWAGHCSLPFGLLTMISERCRREVAGDLGVLDGGVGDGEDLVGREVQFLLCGHLDDLADEL